MIWVSLSEIVFWIGYTFLSYILFCSQWGFGSTGKVWILCLTHLDLSPAISRRLLPLVGIQKGWLHPKWMGFNSSVLLGADVS